MEELLNLLGKISPLVSPFAFLVLGVECDDL